MHTSLLHTSRCILATAHWSVSHQLLHTTHAHAQDQSCGGTLRRSSLGRIANHPASKPTNHPTNQPTNQPASKPTISYLLALLEFSWLVSELRTPPAVKCDINDQSLSFDLKW